MKVVRLSNRYQPVTLSPPILPRESNSHTSRSSVVWPSSRRRCRATWRSAPSPWQRRIVGRAVDLIDKHEVGGSALIFG